MPPNKQDAGPNRIDPESAMKQTPKGETASSGVSSSEEPVSPGNRPPTGTPHHVEKDEKYPAVGEDTSRGPDDHVEATGRDHPSSSEHAKDRAEKLHGTSDKKINDDQ